MIVVDASAVLEVLLNTAAAQRIFLPGQTPHAPHLPDLEVAQVLRRYAFAGDIDAQRGTMALTDFRDLPFTRYPHDFLLPRIWQLRNNVSAYDAAYIALAEVLDAPLITCDQALGQIPNVTATIELVS